MLLGRLLGRLVGLGGLGGHLVQLIAVGNELVVVHGPQLAQDALNLSVDPALGRLDLIVAESGGEVEADAFLGDRRVGHPHHSADLLLHVLGDAHTHTQTTLSVVVSVSVVRHALGLVSVRQACAWTGRTERRVEQ